MVQQIVDEIYRHRIALIAGLLSTLGAIIGASVVFGSMEKQVSINTDRLTVLEQEHKHFSRELAKLLASQDEQDRRLGAIENQLFIKPSRP